MIHDPSFEPAAELADGPDKQAGTKVMGKSAFAGLLVVLVGIAALLWATYDRWSAPVLQWMDEDTQRAAAENNAEPARTPEQQMLIDATQGDLASIVKTGESAFEANKALPFATAPIVAAKPFQMGAIAAPTANRAETCLTQAVYYEAGFEPVSGKRAVAQVVLNRMRHPAFPSSVCGVVYQGHLKPGCQFSFTCDGSLRRQPQASAWKQAKAVALAALSGTVEAQVGTATHYHADYVSPYWAPKLSKISKLGTHIFYRWPGSWGRRAAFNGRYSGQEFIPALRDFAVADQPIVETASERFAKTGVSVPPSITDRHTANDVGGRLDVSKGWKLKIPDPTETSGSLNKLTAIQEQTNPAEVEVEQQGGLELPIGFLHFLQALLHHALYSHMRIRGGFNPPKEGYPFELKYIFLSLGL